MPKKKAAAIRKWLTPAVSHVGEIMFGSEHTARMP